MSQFEQADLAVLRGSCKGSSLIAEKFSLQKAFG